MPYQIDSIEFPDEFLAAWGCAGTHLQRISQGGISWLRQNLHQPLSEHLSFRVGNQLFFVFVEVQGVMAFGEREERLLFMTANEANAVPCLLTMKRSRETYMPTQNGWGLTHARSRVPVVPPLLVTDEPIEMTDWEVHDFAVQIVRDSLQSEGKEVLSWQPSPHIDPSIWFIDSAGQHYVIVRAARLPSLESTPPAQLQEWVGWIRNKSNATGFLAAVGVANADETGRDDNTVIPLYRGHGLTVSYEGLQPL